MLKNSKFAVAITLFVQSVAFFILFIVACFKKKGIAGAFLAIAVAEGTTGTLLLDMCKKEIAATSVSMDEEDLDVDEATLNDSLSRSDIEA
ncbi:MAG: hypothetical protein J6K61_01325 [Clostridia bacterium]|nr:hypothetical protein [Clostridia bacterium]